MNKPVGLLVIPSRLIARNLLCSDFLGSSQMKAFRWVVTTTDAKDRELLSNSGDSQWREYFHPARSNPGRRGLGAKWDQLRYYAGLFVHMHLVHRFNVIASFVGFGVKLKQSGSLRKQYLREGQPMSAIFGFPFPNSTTLYSSLYKFYYLGWQRYYGVESVFDNVKPDFVVIAQLQTHAVTPYVLAARSRDIPIFGVNGSWDQPTTKGPLFPSLRTVFVQNEVVKEDLERFHGCRPEDVVVIGWLQMDSYAEGRRTTISREEFLRGLGEAEASRVILFALNTPRLGGHEPQIVRALYRRIIEGEFGEQTILVLRCHPLDIAWRERWAEFLGSPRVIVEFPTLQSFEQLVASILHSAVIISSAGSFYLDSLALEKPTIGLAWEDETLLFFDRPARAYEMEHLKPMGEIGGTLVKNEIELMTALNQILESSPSCKLKQEWCERYFHKLDGRSADRLAIGLADQVSAVLRHKNRKSHI